MPPLRKSPSLSAAARISAFSSGGDVTIGNFLQNPDSASAFSPSRLAHAAGGLLLRESLGGL